MNYTLALDETNPTIDGGSVAGTRGTNFTNCPKLEYLNHSNTLTATAAPPVYRRKWFLGLAGLAAIAIPALAASDDWMQTGQQDKLTAPSLHPTLMPFEDAAENFPGSAFYYLDEDTGPKQLGDGIYSDADDTRNAPSEAIGAPAKPFRLGESYIDRTRALQCLATAIYYEAASEPDAGQRAVAQVVLNRVAHSAYPSTVCGVVYEGSERTTGCQFSFTCDGSLARRPIPLFWNRAMDKARAALAGSVYTPIGLATHYHTIQVSPYWAPSLHYLSTIGAHRFYKFRGGAGQMNAFRFSYGGGEPSAAPHPREIATTQFAVEIIQDAPTRILDPVAIQQSYMTISDARASAPTPTLALHAPPASPPNYSPQVQQRGGDSIYRARSLPEGNGIKSEYANSGQWIEPAQN